ncbi:MAG: serine acetyltransferase [Lachnospiraceae bacterium]|nr:serine acetyltransferase [Lachnospiraceae bacterium]
MDRELVEQFQRTVSEIYCNYEKNDVLTSKEGRHLPSRSSIIDMIKELRRMMFPGYFGEENMTNYVGDYYVGSHMNNIYRTLKEQIILAFTYCDEALAAEEAAARAEVISREFITKVPQIQEMLLKDVQAGFDGDPAAHSKEDIIISYPGLFAIYVYRIAHELYIQDVPLIPRIMTEYAHSRTGIDINAGARIGEYFFIDHGTGVVIGETTIIGDHVKIYQGVTLGGLSTRQGQALSGVKRHPTIEDNVTIYSGSSILGGDTVIGHDSVIGGNAFITSSVAPQTKVIVRTPEMTFKDTNKKQDDDMSSWVWEI